MKILGHILGHPAQFDTEELTQLTPFLSLFAEHHMADFLMLITGGDETLVSTLLKSAEFGQSLEKKPLHSMNAENMDQPLENLHQHLTTPSQSLAQVLHRIFDVLLTIEMFDQNDKDEAKIKAITDVFSQLLIHQKNISLHFKNYFKKFVNNGSTHPLLDLCDFQFTGSQSYADTWLQLLEKHGPRMAKKIFPHADKIEAYCNLHGIQIPHHKKELNHLVLRSVYKRAEEDLEFASDCLKHKIPEEVFSEALDLYKTSAKKDDNLPKLMIDGKVIGLNRFYLQKLPCHDMRGFILGKYSDCCQHLAHEMGRDAAIAGMTSPNSGFFTICKIPSGHHGPHEIIAQSWAWLSKEGYLVFDSWEFRREQDKAMLVPFMRELIKNLPPEIKGVFIGASGGTPKDLPYLLMTENLPTPLEPMGFSDSRLSQWCVYGPPLEKKNQLQTELT